MRFFEKFFRKETVSEETVSEVMQQRGIELTITVEEELDIEEIIKFTGIKANFYSPKLSWNRVFTDKVVIYNIEDCKNLEDISWELYCPMFSDTECCNSISVLANLMYRIVKETYKNGQKFASLSELLTYSFEEDGHSYTPQDIEKALAKHCLIIERSKDA